MIMQCSYNTFNMYISAGLKVDFFRVINHRQTILGATEKYLTAIDVCEICDVTFWYTL